LAGGIYLMHGFSYYMGLLYRAEHENFPWVLQRHIPTRLMERTRPPGGHLPMTPPAAARPARASPPAPVKQHR
jgi:hypothetical protein